MNMSLRSLVLAACAASALDVFGVESRAAPPPPLKWQATSVVLPDQIAAWHASEVPPTAWPGTLSSPLPRLIPRDRVPGSCHSDVDILCYDYATNGAVYKPSRRLMPEIVGLRRESITLKRDMIRFNYSFK